MTIKAVRAGTTQAKFNDKNKQVFAMEALAVSAGVGLWQSSWWAFLGTFLVLAALITQPTAAKLLAILFGMGWGLIGMMVGSLFGSQAMWVLGIFALLGGIGVNWSSIEFYVDLGATDGKAETNSPTGAGDSPPSGPPPGAAAARSIGRPDAES